MNLFENQGFSAEKFQLTSGAKHECVCIGEGKRTVRLYLHRPSKVAQLRRELFTLWSVCWVEVTAFQWVPGLDAAKEAPFSPGPSRVPNPELHTAGQEKTGRGWWIGLLEGIKGIWSIYQLHCGQPLGHWKCLIHRFFSSGPVCTSPHILPPQGWLLVPIPNGSRERELWQMAGEPLQKAVTVLEAR